MSVKLVWLTQSTHLYIKMSFHRMICRTQKSGQDTEGFSAISLAACGLACLWLVAQLSGCAGNNGFQDASTLEANTTHLIDLKSGSDLDAKATTADDSAGDLGVGNKDGENEDHTLRVTASEDVDLSDGQEEGEDEQPNSSAFDQLDKSLEDAGRIQAQRQEVQRTKKIVVSSTGLYLGSFLELDGDGDGISDQSISLGSSKSSLSMKFDFTTPHQIAPKKIQVKTGIDFFILLDSSGSMGSSIRGAKDNISAFISSLQESYTPRVTIMDFSDMPVVRSFGPKSRASELIAHLAGIRLQGGTREPGLVAMEEAVSAIKLARQEPGGMERFYVMIMITDELSYNSSRNTSTKGIQSLLNSLPFQERIKFFASLKHTAEKNQFKTLLDGSLTNVPVVAERGNVGLAFPFGEQALVQQIVPQIESLIPAVELSCVLHKTTVTPLSGELAGQTFEFDGRRLDVFADASSNKVVAFVQHILDGHNVQKLRSHSVDLVAKRCCMVKQDPEVIYNALNAPEESECVSTHSKKITLPFDP